MSSGATTTCDGCGGLFVDLDAPGHAYVPSSAGCWNAFVQMQADEMQRFRNPPARGLVVDAYMAQHPGDGTDRRDRQSVFIHLIGLCAGLEDGTPHHQLRHLFRRVLDRHPDFPALTRRQGPGPLTVLHIVGASDLTDHERRAREWATAVWESWSSEHGRIRHALRPAAG